MERRSVLACWLLALLAAGPGTAAVAGPPGGGAASEAAVQAVEVEVRSKVNTVRRERGLRPLAADAALSAVARDYSCRMARRHFFAHEAPGGEDLADRLRGAGVAFRAAGENLAMSENAADPAAIAVEGWMESPGHRANVLSRAFTATGVGACRQDREVYITQIFVRPR